MARRDGAGEGALVDRGIVEAHRHRVERTAELLTRDRGDEAGIHATGEERAGGNVAAKALRDGAARDVVDGLERFDFRDVALGGEAEIPVACDAQLTRV